MKSDLLQCLKGWSLSASPSDVPEGGLPSYTTDELKFS